jgi:hypothetical protein
MHDLIPSAPNALDKLFGAAIVVASGLFLFFLGYTMGAAAELLKALPW